MPGDGLLPNSFSTTRNEPCSEPAVSSSKRRMVSRARAMGTADWCWKKPRRPYSRFQPAIDIERIV